MRNFVFLTEELGSTALITSCLFNDFLRCRRRWCEVMSLVSGVSFNFSGFVVPRTYLS